MTTYVRRCRLFCEWFFWRQPAKMWRVIWDFAVAWDIAWLIFVPWGFLAATFMVWEVYQLFARSLPTSSLGPLDAFPLSRMVKQGVTHVAASDWFFNSYQSSWTWLMLYVLGVVAFAYCGLGPLHVLVGRYGKRRIKKTHGSAAWGSVEELIATGALSTLGQHAPPGFMLGRVSLTGADAVKYDSRLLHTGHILTCAATRSGKGIGGAIPNLLSYPGSTFAVDIKGELYAVTAKARRRLGCEVARIDPFQIAGENAPSHSINWLDSIDLTTTMCISEARVLIEAIVERSEGENRHWDDAAADLLLGIILHVSGMPLRSRNMGTVRDILRESALALRNRFKSMQAQETQAFGMVAKVANSFLSKSDRELDIVLSTAQRHTTFLDEPMVRKTLRTSSFQFTDLKEKKLAVYLMIPANQVDANRQFLRATLAMSLHALTKTPRKPAHDVAYFLDEFPRLGYLAAVESALPILHGYGVLLWLFIQDLSQLRGTYRKWESFIGNCTLQTFGTQDLGTAKYISDTLGNETIRIQTAGSSESQGVRGNGTHSHSQQESFLARPLATPDEVRRLSRDQVVVVRPAQKPLLLQRLNYLEDPEFVGVADANPMHPASHKDKDVAGAISG